MGQQEHSSKPGRHVQLPSETRTVRRPLHQLNTLVQVDQVLSSEPVGLDFVFGAVILMAQHRVRDLVGESGSVVHSPQLLPDHDQVVFRVPTSVLGTDGSVDHSDTERSGVLVWVVHVPPGRWLVELLVRLRFLVTVGGVPLSVELFQGHVFNSSKRCHIVALDL